MSLSIHRDDLLPGRNFIGRWCEAEEGRRFDVTDPATDAVVASVLHLRPLEVIFDLGECLPVEIRIAKDTAVGGNNRDPRVQQLRKAIRFVVQCLVRRE